MDALVERKHEKYDRLIAKAQQASPPKTAVVHPCDQNSLEGAVDAARLGLIAPILVGPRGAHPRGRRAASSIDISALPIVDAEHSHDSAAKGGGAGARGQSRGPDEGQPSHRRTDERRGEARHAAAHRAAAQPLLRHGRAGPYADPLIITDAAINIAPTLDDKVDILQNAIDLAHAWDCAEVRVAILSAMETVNPKIPSTIEAGALCKMADRGQITGAILDGPLAFDNAISREAAAIKHIDSPVAGRANLLVVPDLEAGNMLAKSLSSWPTPTPPASCWARACRSS